MMLLSIPNQSTAIYLSLFNAVAELMTRSWFFVGYISTGGKQLAGLGREGNSFHDGCNSSGQIERFATRQNAHYRCRSKHRPSQENSTQHKRGDSYSKKKLDANLAERQALPVLQQRRHHPAFCLQCERTHHQFHPQHPPQPVQGQILVRGQIERFATMQDKTRQDDFCDGPFLVVLMLMPQLVS
jgi:hypothetical protein